MVIRFILRKFDEPVSITADFKNDLGMSFKVK